MRMCHFWSQNGPFVLNKIFWCKSLLLFPFTYWPFSLCKTKKFFTAGPELWGCTIFGPKMVHLHQFFFGKLLVPLSSTYKHLLLCKILKIFSCGSRVMRMCNFWAQNNPFPQMRIFFRKPVNETCFFH